MTPADAPDWTPACLSPDVPTGVAVPSWLDGARIEVHRDGSGAVAVRAIPAAGEAGSPPACVEAGGVVWVARPRPLRPPPSTDGWVPLRSLRVEAPPAAVAAAAGVAAGPRLDLPARDGAPALRLHLQAVPGGTMLHALAAPAGPDGLVAASRALEALRCAAEGPSGPGGA